MNLKFWQPKRKLEVIRVNTTDLRLRAWRSDEHLLSAAKTLQGNHTYAMVVQVLRNELMAMARGVGEDATVNQQVARQRIAQGYSLAIDHLESMSVKPEKQKELVESFAPENSNPPKTNAKRPVPQGLGW
jgi:hypothetical protein